MLRANQPCLETTFSASYQFSVSVVLLSVVLWLIGQALDLQFFGAKV
jgi:hypothetical protein